MKRKKANKLFKKYLNDKCSPKEKDLLESFLDSYQGKDLRLLEWKPYDKAGFQEKSLKNIKKKIHIEKNSNPGSKLQRFKVLKYAAVLACILGVSYFYVYQNNNVPVIQSVQLIITDEDITLEMENGIVKVIEPAGKEKIIDKSGKVIGTQNGTELVYSKDTEKEKLEYNTLTVPYGKQFEVQLSDGTNVHLNAGTSLKYPVKFIKGKNRCVYLLSGEAYFDVVKDAQHPFLVNSDEMNIRVLGTKFNVSAYPEDRNINTVLVEGAVSLYNKNANYSKKRSMVLTPNHKASWNRLDNHTVIEEVEVDEYIAWIDGRLVFKNIMFSNIIKKLERKYNVTIVNNNLELDTQFYDATFDFETIEQVLKSFNQSYAIEYTIENNKVIIN
jgi:ferric-dicitrate binding protein FerR (iron transport regulator)|tara:strand:- start:565 stop:1719 length:1155 start_codon:yes stop_codon:yes gene_type:complete